MKWSEKWPRAAGRHGHGHEHGTPVRCGRACRSMIAEVKESAFIVDHSDDLVGDPQVKVESVDERGGGG